MNWSNAALKMTIGVGLMGVTALLSDPLAEVIGIYGMIGVVVAPFALLVFFKQGELADGVIKALHLLAAIWYLVLVSACVYVMVSRGFIRSDLLMGGFMALGLAPVCVILRNMWRGEYDVN